MQSGQLAFVQQIEQLRNGDILHQRLGAQIVNQQKGRVQQGGQGRGAVFHVSLPGQLQKMIGAGIDGQHPAIRQPMGDAA